MKPVFDIKKYPSGGTCMRCDTENKARIFLTYLDSLGLKWRTGESYINELYWTDYKEKTVYYFNDGSYGSGVFAEQILEFDDFDWSKWGYRELKGGDLLNMLGGNK